MWGMCVTSVDSDLYASLHVCYYNTWCGKLPHGDRSVVQCVFQSHLFPPPTKHIYFQELGAHGKGQDFISLGLQNGHLVFRWLSFLTPYFFWHLDEYCYYFQPCINVVVTQMICMIISYQLGSGEAEILSRKSINDGRWHKITAVRYD